MKFLVRMDCEYSIEVDAKDEKAAMSKIKDVPLHEWSQAWSEFEVE